MPYFLVFLLLTACGQKTENAKPEASAENIILTPPRSSLVSQKLSQEIPLEKFSRTHLSPYNILPNGKVAMYTNEFGIALPNWEEKALTEEEIYKFLYDVEWGFIQVASEITADKKEFVSTKILYESLKNFTPDRDSLDAQSFLSLQNFIYPDSWTLLYELYSPYEILGNPSDPFPLLTPEKLEAIFGKTPQQKAISHFNRYLSIMLFGELSGKTINHFSPFPYISPELMPDSISEERATVQPWLTNKYSFKITKSTNIITP